jgi:hypothetical protein
MRSNHLPTFARLLGQGHHLGKRGDEIHAVPIRIECRQAQAIFREIEMAHDQVEGFNVVSGGFAQGLGHPRAAQRPQEVVGHHSLQTHQSINQVVRSRKRMQAIDDERCSLLGTHAGQREDPKPMIDHGSTSFEQLGEPLVGFDRKVVNRLREVDEC